MFLMAQSSRSTLKGLIDSWAIGNKRVRLPRLGDKLGCKWINIPALHPAYRKCLLVNCRTNSETSVFFDGSIEFFLNICEVGQTLVFL